MAVKDWSANADENTQVDGINIAENCPAKNTNNALRAIMAAVRSLYDGIPNAGGFVSAAKAVFTGEAKRDGQGAFLHYVAASMQNGQVIVQPEGQALPGNLPDGTLVLTY